jgi:hypothetical protein
LLAFIHFDFCQWHEWKSLSGIYFLSRQKDNKNHLDLQRNWGDAIAKLDHACSR